MLSLQVVVAVTAVNDSCQCREWLLSVQVMAAVTAVFEMGGGAVCVCVCGGGNPHNCTGPWHLCFSRGPRVGL